MKPSGYRIEMINQTQENWQTHSWPDANGHALMFVLFMDAIFGNIGAGSFVSFLLPNMLKKDQKGETATINPEVNP